MAILYFDSSAFVKLVVEEEGSETAAALWDAADAVAASRLAYVEVHAALAAAGRDHRLASGDLGDAGRGWEEFWAAVRPVELTDRIASEAGELAARHALRGADAVHLASARALDDGMVQMVVWDRRLRLGASATGVTVAPVSDP